MIALKMLYLNIALSMKGCNMILEIIGIIVICHMFNSLESLCESPSDNKWADATRTYKKNNSCNNSNHDDYDDYI